MSDASPPPRHPGGHPFPPPPPSERKPASGCLKYGLIGCGALLVLLVVVAVGGYFWITRNPQFGEAAGAATQEGARFGLQADEAACVEAGAGRVGEVGTITAGLAAGAFVRGCLEFSRETPGFCENVPPPTALRRTIAWRQERCGDDAACGQVMQIVQTYCAEGRPKRIAADTLTWDAQGVEIEGRPAPDGHTR
jgi:hypothetical protein